MAEETRPRVESMDSQETCGFDRQISPGGDGTEAELQDLDADGDDGTAEEDEITIDMLKMEGETLGVTVDSAYDRGRIRIAEINEGLIEEWNRDHPKEAIEKGDFIASVNGTGPRGPSHYAGPEAMFEEIKKDGNLLIKVQRACTATPSSKVADREKVVIEDLTANAGDDEKFQLADKIRLEGNALLGEGDFEAASKKYDEGLQMIHEIKADQDQKDKVSLPFRLNNALANLKRGNLGVARMNCHIALTIDPSNVKALYRRAMVQVRMAREAALFNDEEARAAVVDFESLLKLDPSNADARRELQSLLLDQKKHHKSVEKDSKKTWGHMFNKENTEFIKPDDQEPEPPVRPCNHGDRRLVVDVKDATLRTAPGARGELVLDSLNLELREYWCVGLLGRELSGDRASALAQMVMGTLSPFVGSVNHHAKKPVEPVMTVPVLLAVTSALVLFCAMLAAVDMHWSGVGGMVVVGLLIIGGCVYWYFEDKRLSAESKILVVQMTSARSDWEGMKAGSTIESIIGDVFPKVSGKKIDRTESRDKVIAMLESVGFQTCDRQTGKPVGTPAEYVRDGLQYGQISNENQQLVHIMRCLASGPQVLICNDPVEGLDDGQQARVLRMIRRMKIDQGTSILYVSMDVHQHRLLADSLGFLSKGVLIESGAATEVIELPRHSETKEYIARQMGNAVFLKVGQKLGEDYAALLDDKALEGPWLPRKEKKRPPTLEKGAGQSPNTTMIPAAGQ